MKKNNIFLVFMGVVLFVSAYILPTLFLVAFNFTKGIMLNEDGIVLIPLGIGLILLTVGLDAMLIWKALKNFRGRKYGRVIVLVSAVFAVPEARYHAPPRTSLPMQSVVSVGAASRASSPSGESPTAAEGPNSAS